MARTHTRSRREAAGDAGVSAAVVRAGRVPPHDLEAEKSVLSALLLDNTAIHAVLLEVRPEDFYHPVHQVLYRAMVELNGEHQPIDLRTLSDHLTRHKLMDRIGGPVALAEIADFETTAAHVIHHARIVRDRAVKRRLIGVATEIVELGFEGSERAEQLLDEAESRIFEISRDNARSSFADLGDELHRAFDYLDAMRERGHELTGVPTGFRDIDKVTGGLHRGELVILAARPSMGKTALALNIARNAAVNAGKRVAVFSLEMSAQALVLRLLAAEARVDASIFRSPYFSNVDYQKLQRGASQLTGAPIVIDDSSTLRVLELKAKCRRLKAESGLDLVVVDYLQLMHGDGRSERREQEISEISRGLKSLAKELDVPVLALSQLNRGPETRPGKDKRPLLSDLRESGAIEQDADVIAFIYRDEFYNRDDPENRGLAEFIIAKQRNGPTGTVKLGFEARHTLFLDRSERDDEPGEPPRGGGFVSAIEPDLGGDIF